MPRKNTAATVADEANEAPAESSASVLDFGAMETAGTPSTFEEAMKHIRELEEQLAASKAKKPRGGNVANLKPRQPRVVTLESVIERQTKNPKLWVATGIATYAEERVKAGQDIESALDAVFQNATRDLARDIIEGRGQKSHLMYAIELFGQRYPHALPPAQRKKLAAQNGTVTEAAPETAVEDSYDADEAALDEAFE